MISIAVVVHAGKTLGGGLDELRSVLASAGYPEPRWYEVAHSRNARQAIHRSVKDGADLIFIWGGDGMVQRCVDALRGSDVAVAILPAGTGNLLAATLGIPKDIAKAVDIGLNGTRRRLDVGVLNGERFAAMAGTGFDAIMVGKTSSEAKERFGRLAYIRSGVKAARARSVRMKVSIDDAVWFNGEAACLLVGNIGTVTGGLEIFPDASPSDGVLEVGVFTPRSSWQWFMVFLREAMGRAKGSPHIESTRGRRIEVKLQHKRPYELDGGARPPTKRLKFHVQPGAITLCVPTSVDP